MKSINKNRRILITALLLSCCVLLTACVPANSTGICGETSSDSTLEGPFLKNPRFEALSSNLVPSDNYWGIPNERFAVKYDRLTYYLTDEGYTCDFSNEAQTVTEGCRLCDLCNNRCGRVFIFNDDKAKPILTTYEGSMFTPTPTLTEYLLWTDGCSLNWTEQSRKIITLTKNATYEIRDAESISCEPGIQNRTVRASLTARVIEGGPQNAVYGMESHTESSQPNTALFKWSTTSRTETDPNTNMERQRWTDNFSQSLKVTKVKVVVATKGDDNLEDNTPLRPSRLVFIQDYSPTASFFNQDNNFCYADAASDGSFDLSRCRQSLMQNPQTLSHDLTPTYIKTNLQSRLTWFVEFNPMEGAAAPTFNPETEEIKVVFTTSR